MSLGVNFEIDNNLSFNNNSEFCFGYYLDDELFGYGDKVNKDVYFNIEIDSLLKLMENEVVIRNKPELYIIANTEEEKL